MTTKVFIDGKAGTTGLRIYERLSSRSDIELLTLSDEERKNPVRRKEMLNGCDIAFLCLPDDAAREAITLIDNPNVTVLDTSTAHRTLPDWAYGFPELGPAFRHKIENSRRIAVPGCHAGGFIALVQPLVAAGLIAADLPLSCHSITGYSGGGKKMIAEYEAEGRDVKYAAPRQYGLTQQHKHLKEMAAITGLTQAPIFSPVVADFYSGMVMTVPLFRSQLRKDAGAAELKALYRELYRGPVVRFCDDIAPDGMIGANALSGSDAMEITVAGNEDRILLIARYDNLGKGASGAAVECMNIAMKIAPETGLSL